jgi:quercetin dioxygenase-like cupin family protein|tara:strand:- start:563 stop:811 length:249 start_codon:yes stop_codon:yes gene_type:complete
MQPYKDSSNIRSFSKNVKKLELVWHKDDEDRDIEILEGKGWQMQFDNELPFELVKGDHIFITKHRIHRIHKGTTDLKIKING